FGLVVEGIDLAGGAGHEQLHDAPGAGAVVQATVEVGARRGPWAVGEQALAAEQVGQGDAAQAPAGLPEERAAVEKGLGHGCSHRGRSNGVRIDAELAELFRQTFRALFLLPGALALLPGTLALLPGALLLQLHPLLEVGEQVSLGVPPAQPR